MQATTTILSELEEYLRQKDLTVTQFAKRSQLHSGTLSNILRGHRPIAMQQLDRITQAMGR
ncbi:helix-turn-helix domain-containing protein [Paenibacillus silagei]|uniref:Transcriptional regulator n=1 Tax=Paenibacillus silagei TaxID=1670801 RepID=A0ABS4P0V4_9BACL|nr:helix-turn-helix transcriptional regulator [Paenibacillus silagei]MBP2115931.1 putative transcriptional regulator [Paenibacillus silagei]